MNTQEIEQYIHSLRHQNGRSINLSHHRLTVVPLSIETLTCAQHMLLNNNCIAMPPQELCSLIKLKELILDHNRLTMLPSGFGCLKNLNILSLSHNPISSLPAEIGDLQSLTHLWIVDAQSVHLFNSHSGRKAACLLLSLFLYLEDPFLLLSCISIRFTQLIDFQN